MPTIIAYDELEQTRIAHEVKGGTRWNTNFMQPPKGTRLPQAFLVENTPHRHLRTHFHDVDQFQVIMQGGGTLGKHAVRPYAVHFSRALTPYGPIQADEEGIAWLTLRARRDAEGAQFIPEKREKLAQAGPRKPWQVSEIAEFVDPVTDVALNPLPGVRDERGLAAYALRMKPNTTCRLPAPTGTGGQYLVVVAGSLHGDGKTQRSLTIGYVDPVEPALEVHAGPEGMDALVLNFPRHDEPVAAAAPSESATGFKTWQCMLCAFVYDEAKGLPEEGIAPGTRWEDVPDDFICGDCGATKADFEMVEV
jgi:rubredoxin